MPHTEAVRNWRLLEIEIVEALEDDGWYVGRNAAGDPCIGDVNIARLARVLSERVLVKVTPLSVKI